MKDNKYVVVIGEPRCGMTSLLKKLSDGKWNGRSDTLCTVEFNIPGMTPSNKFLNISAVIYLSISSVRLSFLFMFKLLLPDKSHEQSTTF